MDFLLLVTSAGATVIGTLIFYLIKNINHRVRFLEENNFTKKDVRQLVEDKIGGIHSDLRDIKTKIDKLFDIYIENKLGRK